MTDSDNQGLLLTESEFHEILTARLPFAQIMGLEAVCFDTEKVRLKAVYNEQFLRPGGTIAGPIMMGLADAAVYALILSRIGPVELAVTTHLSINFLRKPEPSDLLADARLLKLGKRLAVADVVLFTEKTGKESPVAHATATYSIPPPDLRPS